ncbi:pentapeptide repeat-containing protein [Streptomyces hygroscopicus]|uniref:pentapeptide repeat-containing protein n=1 Tax=Streptomyces hygroscopicus TaxID=1912 RepID=UPI00369D8F06
MSILIASLVAVAGLWYSSVQTQQANDQARQERALTKEGQITDRFNAAVGNLGDEADEVRLGGIFALRRIMEDSPRDQPAVVDVLSGYIRTRAPAAGGGTKRDAGGRPAPDVRAAFETLTQRNPVHDKSARVDLRDTHLRYIGVRPGPAGAEETGANGQRLERANLSGADLANAHLPRALLSGTHLVGTRLEGADLRRADLRGTDLRGAQLVGADLKGADLRGAWLRIEGSTGGNSKNAPDTDSPASEQPAKISADQLLETQWDHTTLLPSALKDDPRIRKRLSRMHTGTR